MIDPEFERRSRAFPQEVKARLHHLVAKRGHGGHLGVEITALLAEEMRERAAAWAGTTLRVFQHTGLRPTEAVAADFRAELQRYSNRDIEQDVAAIKQIYPWLPLDETEILAARQSEIERQVANLPLQLKPPKPWHEHWYWRAIGGITAFAAALAGVLAYLGIGPWKS